MHARDPALVDDVGVEIVLGGAAAGAMEIPEVARRDRMPAGAKRRAPAAARHIEAAAEELVDARQLEGEVMKAAFLADVEQEQVVVMVRRAAAQEVAAA